MLLSRAGASLPCWTCSSRGRPLQDQSRTVFRRTMSQLSSPAMVTHTCMHTHRGNEQPLALLILLPATVDEKSHLMRSPL